MSKHLLATKKAGDPASKGLFQSIDAAMESIRRLAYDLFRARGGAPASDLDDWFNAERELFEVPSGEMGETPDAFVVKMAVPGFAADQLEVGMDAASITIRGEAEKKHKRAEEKQTYTEFIRKGVFRRFNLPGIVDVDKVKANLTGGHLTITMPKIAKPEPSTATTQLAA